MIRYPLEANFPGYPFVSLACKGIVRPAEKDNGHGLRVLFNLFQYFRARGADLVPVSGLSRHACLKGLQPVCLGAAQLRRNLEELRCSRFKASAQIQVRGYHLLGLCPLKGTLQIESFPLHKNAGAGVGVIAVCRNASDVRQKENIRIFAEQVRHEPVSYLHGEAECGSLLIHARQVPLYRAIPPGIPAT